MRETVMKVSFHGNKYLNTSREEDKRESLSPAMPLFLTRSWTDDYSNYREVNYVCCGLEGTVSQLIISLANGCPPARANVLGMLMQGNLGSDHGKKDVSQEYTLTLLVT